MKKIKTLKTTKILTYVLVGAFLLYLNSIEISYSKPLSPEQFIQEGKSLFEKGDYEQSLQKLTQAEAYFKSSQVKSKTERLSEIYFLQGLNFAKQGNEKISKEMFKRALHYSSDKEYDTTLLDENAKEIFTKAKIEFEQEFSPKAIGMQGEQYQKKGGSAGWIVLAVIAIAAVGVLTYFLVKELQKEDEPDTGTIQVNSTPTGAAIWLDGTDTGKATNAALADVSPGAHALKLIKEGYKVWEDTVNVNKGATTHVNATLEEEPKVGKIKVNSTPTGADIWLDGTDTGKTTNATLNNVSVGDHALKLVKERYQDWEDTVTVTEDTTTTVNATLEVGAFTEDFNDGVANHWKTKYGQWKIEGGIYICRDKSDNNTRNNVRSYYDLGKFSDFTLTAEAKRTEPANKVIGIAFRGNTDFNKYYVLDVHPDQGEYSVWKVEGTSYWGLVSWTSHSSINTSGWNKLQIVAKGNDFSIYINDIFVDNITISGVRSEGKVGLWTYFYSGANNDETHFDNVSLSLETTVAVRARRGRIVFPMPPRLGETMGGKF